VLSETELGSFPFVSEADIRISDDLNFGGETASTGTKKPRLHAERFLASS